MTRPGVAAILKEQMKENILNYKSISSRLLNGAMEWDQESHTL